MDVSVPRGLPPFAESSEDDALLTLDEEISSAFSLLGLLLVFVIGYFAAFLPQAQDLLERSAPDVAADRRTLVTKIRTYRVLLGGVLALTIATGVVVAPLTRRVVLTISFRGPFPTIEAGLLPIDVMLVALFAVSGWVWVRLGRRIRALASRSRKFASTMRRSRNVPLVEVPPGAKCCDGIISVSAADLPFRQRFTPGTTAWRKSYRRRNVVEGVNVRLKGGFVNIGQKFFRVFWLTKLTFLLAFTIAGYNVERIRSFNARKEARVGAAMATKKRRRKRRKGTWGQLLDGARPAAGPDPPPD